jgi:hypothetical protein
LNIKNTPSTEGVFFLEKGMNNKKNVTRMERMQQRLDAGCMADLFPEVAGIDIRMTYNQQGIKSLLRTFSYSPGSYAYFKVDCLSKDCVDGGFDLTQVITGMIRKRREAAKGELSCGGDGPEADHSAIAYEVAIHYT